MNNSILKNGFYNSITGLIKIGLGILIIPVLIRLLGIEEYGLWTLASAVVVMVTLAEAGLSTATTVFVSQDLGKKDIDGLSQTLTVTFGAILILATLAVVALWMGAEPIMNLFPKLGQLQQLKVIQAIKIGGLVVAARLLQQILIGVEQAHQRYDLMNVLNTMQSVLLNVGMLIVVLLGGRTVELMQWQAGIGVVTLLSHIWVVRSLLQNLNLRLNWNQPKALAVGGYSLMMWLNTLGSMLFSRGDRLIVGSLLGSQVLGVYAGITDITAQINSFSALPVQPLLPTLSNLIGQQNINQRQLEQQLKQATQINGLFALGMGATLITLSPLILKILFSEQTVSQYLITFCIATVIYALYSCHAVGYYSLLATNAVKACALIQLLASFSSLGLIAIGAYNFGLTGAIIGNLGYFTAFAVTIFGMKRLSISYYLWFKWLCFPLIWFFIVLLVNFKLQNDYILRFIMLSIQTTILLTWFAISNNYNLSFFKKYITAKK
ncbi:lipopolysaccharide biosynthesis protein [Nostoc sp. 'Peltigera membranacea cyanobiont' N6]|uniref:lipopolysaccharide biosynthesis protein n=1 Tax=Nostoc sp. 'Peltigera membranacea cyanobiont' N6 TaxID=1261031 RepID=UPI000CF360D1|nr:oligosaccharide flippase family protein [Nostoc sp. 'Peltigera membranacea cyanobiont' N6]AVH65955.1 polysaccharide biosynthesis protein [Nostoc sp. 'Peltigera membranacea cyanobiont' N6]